VVAAMGLAVRGDGDDRAEGVTFPRSIDVHSATQLYYFDDAGLLRRLDYQLVVNGDTPVTSRSPDGTAAPPGIHPATILRAPSRESR
jgi:hypothetical protein